MRQCFPLRNSGARTYISENFNQTFLKTGALNTLSAVAQLAIGRMAFRFFSFPIKFDSTKSNEKKSNKKKLRANKKAFQFRRVSLYIRNTKSRRSPRVICPVVEYEGTLLPGFPGKRGKLERENHGRKVIGIIQGVFGGEGEG